MEKNVSQQSKTEKETTEIVKEESPEIIPDSMFKKFFLEIASITNYTFRFFNEKQSFLINYTSLSLVVTGFIIGLVLTIQFKLIKLP